MMRPIHLTAREKKFLVIGLLVVLAAGLWVGVFEPINKKIAITSAALNQVVKDLKEVKSLAGQEGVLDSKLEALKAEMNSLDRKLGYFSSVTEVLPWLEQEVVRVKGKIVRFKVLPAKVDGDFLVYPVELTVEGNYNSLVALAEVFESTPGQITLDKVQVAGTAKSVEGVFNLNVIVKKGK